ncbi:hypothetical protein [Paenibacillus alvei]|uniref:hypothetical protein n=1 Tax=Paenibacillus alvei TaxID=44250 RepID=UPI001FD4FFFE|nr:hypothetical protein [Paenibacillus alvei]
MSAVLIIGKGTLADIVYTRLQEHSEWTVARIGNINEDMPKASIAIVLQEQENLGSE